jgi:cytochrome d ubiquinol oxidase subunit II
VIATFAQDIVLAFIQGFKVDGRNFVGSSFDCFTPFSLLTGLALVFGLGSRYGQGLRSRRFRSD